ncbi:hypothetical protein [Staphylococcus simulans]|uniref:hypothetical protein n=1 Tax=Staphylococcus simulans TaxID=1286 RepID=UPI000D036707|nr:hypothetical protein [Staphylococcus simulans]
MKSFWIAYAFCFASTSVLTLITQDFIISWSLLLSLAVYLFFDVWYFEEDETEEAVDDDEYITLFTIKY